MGAFRFIPIVVAIAAAASSCNPRLNGGADLFIQQGFQVAPATSSVAIYKTQTLAAVGGKTPYSFQILSGPGTINSSTGEYTAPTTFDPMNTLVSIEATDGEGTVFPVTINLVDELLMTPTTAILPVSSQVTLFATGGLPPYVFSVVSGTGAIFSSTATSATFQATAVPGTSVFRVRDSLGNRYDSTLTIAPAFGGGTVTLQVQVGGTVLISPVGGVPGYTFSITSALGGTLNSGSLSSVYTAPMSVGTENITVQDSNSSTQAYDIVVNPAIDISSATQLLAAGTSLQMTVSGGVPFAGPAQPYNYDLVSGGSLASVSATGLVTAGTIPGSVVVRATDSAGNADTRTLTIYKPVQISPSSISLTTGTVDFPFGTTYGVGPFTYSLVSGVGSITGNLYSAGAVQGTAQVRVTDTTTTETSMANIQVFGNVLVSPISVNLAPGNVHTITPSGGLTPYAYTKSCSNPVGTLSATSGSSTDFTAGTTTGICVVTVTDAAAQSQTVTLNVTGPLAVSPTSFTLAVNNTQIITATGGVAPYFYSASSGTFSGNQYQAPATSGADTITVTDSYSPANQVTIPVTVNSALAISPSSQLMNYVDQVTLSASGGVPSAGNYTFTLLSAPAGATLTTTSGTGSSPITGTQARFNSAAASGGAVVRLTDSLGNISDSVIFVATPPLLNAGTGPIPLALTTSYNVTPTGGIAPYDFAITTGGAHASIPACNDVTTCLLTAGSGGGSVGQTVVVTVTDSVGATATLGFDLRNLPQLSVGYTTIAHTNNLLLGSNSQVISPVSYILSGGTAGGTITSGIYDPANAGTAQIRVQDGAGNLSAPSTITVVNPPVLTPASFTLASGGNTQALNVTGGVPNY
ncbi:MAG: hypothetical protein JNL01_00195, partial [Bdellovibrionales bacterium]|nr:hypothetical protein [Bdellovibrionales bacterium]